MEMKTSRTFIAVPPGATIREQLDDRGMSQKEFSSRMGMSEKHISRLINGDVQLTPEVAYKLEMVLGVPAEFWNNLEAIYREKLVKVLCDKSISAVLLKVNPEIADSLFTTRMLSQECATIWKGKRIYVVSDENIPRGTETMLAMVGSVLTLPPDARMLY